jgi:hypothetical protein
LVASEYVSYGGESTMSEDVSVCASI